MPYKYNKTITGGAERFIDGIENIEMFLDEQDNWNFHDSDLKSFSYDNDEQRFTITIEPIGFLPTIEGLDEDKIVLLDFHFEGVIELEMSCLTETDISEIEFSVYNKEWLNCWLDNCGIRVQSQRVRVDKPRFVQKQQRTIPQEIRDVINVDNNDRISYIGKQRGKDAYIRGYIGRFGELMPIGLPVVYLFDGKNVESICGEEAKKIIRSY